MVFQSDFDSGFQTLSNVTHFIGNAFNGDVYLQVALTILQVRPQN